MSAPRSPRERLVGCLERLQSGPWSFVQLRGHLLSENDLDGDDVDLLGTAESVSLLLEECFRWVSAGDCHVRIERRRPEKTELTLFSIDGKHRVLFDLWVEIWQLNRRRQCLRFEDVSEVLKKGGGLRRMNEPLELCVYVQHLICKKKDVSREEVRSRLSHYRARIEESGESQLSEMIDYILSEGIVTERIDSGTIFFLQQELGIEPEAKSGRPRGLGRLWREGVLSPPRRTTLLSLMGCDGSGKTSLGQHLASDLPEVDRLFTGKHLYRKSLVYKLAVIFLRPLTFQSREKFDEILAPLVYLRACLGLEIRKWRTGEKLTLIDRNLIDFLYLDRKSDLPRFSRFRWLARLVGRRIPVVHCILPYEALVKRKDEMTEQGHCRYDEDMFSHLATRVPTSYVLFNNSGELEGAVEALGRIVQRMRPS